MTVVAKLRELGYETIPEEFYDKVSDWKAWYVGKVKNFHTYKRYNGKKFVNCERASMGMGKKVCEDWANLLMNEKVKIVADGAAEQTFIDKILAENNFLVKMSEMQELKCAFGTTAYVPRVTGQVVDSLGNISPGAAAGIAIDYVTIENIFPLTWQNGYISECAFASEFFVDGSKYLYLQIHHKGQDGLYVIENRLYRYDNEILSDVDMGTVRGFENVPSVVYTGSDKRQFVIDRPNIANNVDYTLPVGVSVFANAIDVLRGVDCAYDCYVNEFENGPMYLLVKMSATDWENGTPTVADDDRRFYLLPEDTQQGQPVQAVAPELRSEQLNVGLQDQLNILASKCGFGEAYYKFDAPDMTTATQVISENSTLFRSIKKHEIILEQVLTELCRIILRMGNYGMGQSLNPEVKIKIDFDDSIIEDKNAEFTRDLQLLTSAIMNDWEFRAKWMSESDEEAKKNLPKMEDMTDEEETEIE